MIEFQLEKRGLISHQRLFAMSTKEIYSDDRHFRVLIDNTIYFEDDFFPILEFVLYAVKWISSSKHDHDDFIYNTTDDYQNPLLAFIRDGDLWKIDSIWKNYECKRTFSLMELECFINSIICEVIVPY